MFTKLTDPPLFAEAFPALKNSTLQKVQLSINESLMVERCKLDLRLRKSIACVANVVLAASQLPMMTSEYCHLILDLFDGTPAVTLLPLRDFKVERFEGSHSVCYHMVPLHVDLKPFALKKCHSQADSVVELKLWQMVYGLSANQVVLTSKNSTTLLLPWFDVPSLALQSDDVFVAKVKKLCKEIQDAGNLIGENWIHGDIRWANVGCHVVEGKNEYLPVMLDLSSLHMNAVKCDYYRIGGSGKPKVNEKELTMPEETKYEDPILPRLKEYFTGFQSLRQSGLCD